jgi:hypothetical protein
MYKKMCQALSFAEAFATPAAVLNIQLLPLNFRRRRDYEAIPLKLTVYIVLKTINTV